MPQKTVRNRCAVLVLSTLAAACSGKTEAVNAQGGGAGVSGAGGGSAAGSGGGGSGGIEPGSGVSVEGEGYIVRRFLIGDEDRDGTRNYSAWQQYGTDIDGLSSTETSQAHCKLQPGAKPEVKTDAPDGVDNNFGKVILPILLAVTPTPSDAMAMRVAQGRSLTLIVGPDLRAPNLLGSMGRATSPTSSYDLSKPWLAFSPDTMDNTSRCGLSGQGSETQLRLNGFGTWDLRVPVEGRDLVVPIHRTQVLAELEPGSALPQNSIIVGVIRTEELVDAVRRVAGFVDEALCGGSTIESIVSQIRAASDLSYSAGPGDPSVECDAISFGMGVELDPVVVQGRVPPEAVPNACP
ncbi:MAG: hypothetical protein AB7S68_34350 [Polyangiaceae bacterium]